MMLKIGAGVPPIHIARRLLQSADPLYLWSALIGVGLAGILIALSQVLANRG